MKAEELKIKYPAGFESAVHMTKDEMEQHIRLMSALKMFELGKISAGKAAEFAGMSRVEFYEICGRYRVSIFNYAPEELEDEIKKDFQTLKEWGAPKKKVKVLAFERETDKEIMKVLGKHG